MVALTSEPTADVRVTISDPGGDLILQNPENFVLRRPMRFAPLLKEGDAAPKEGKPESLPQPAPRQAVRPGPQ